MPPPRREELVLLNIRSLPKDKGLLDYLLQQLSPGSSPERFELLEALFNLYLTSTGFNPSALSKVRFKRIRATEFRKLLIEIDLELGKILESEEYLQILRHAEGPEPLFNEYKTLGTAIATMKADETVRTYRQFEKDLARREAWELLLLFQKNYGGYLTLPDSWIDPSELRENYQRQRYEILHSLDLIDAQIGLAQLELKRGIGMKKGENIRSLSDTVSGLLLRASTTASRIQASLLMLRCAKLSESPRRSITAYLTLLMHQQETVRRIFPEQLPMMLAAIARYRTDLSHEERIIAFTEADQSAKNVQQTLLRCEIQIEKAIFLADEGKLTAARNVLKESEHLLHRSTELRPIAESVWLQAVIIQYFLLCLDYLKNQKNLRKISEPAGLMEVAQSLMDHRSDKPALLLEMRAVLLLLESDFMAAYDAIKSVDRYRTEEGNYPDAWFSQGLILALRGEEDKFAEFIAKAGEQAEPMYSGFMLELLQELNAWCRAKNPRPIPLIPEQ